MDEVVGIAKEATCPTTQQKSFRALVTVDVKDAFNVARRSIVVEELEKRWHIDGHLIKLVRSCLKNRVLLMGAMQMWYRVGTQLARVDL